MRRSWIVATGGFALGILAAVGHAQPSPDAGLADASVADATADPYERGVELRQNKDWEEACEQFDVAVRLDPSPRAVLALGECRERAGDWTEASVLYQAADIAASARGDDDVAKAAASSDGRVRARTFGVRLDRKRVEIGAWVAYSVDGRAIRGDHLAHVLRLPPGRHVFGAVRPGCAAWSHEVEGVEGQRMTVEVPPLRCYEDAKPVFRRSSRRGSGPKFAYWVAAAGGFSLGTGLFLEFQASGKRANAKFYGCEDDQCRDPVGREFLREADDLRTRAIVAALVGAVALGGSLWVIYSDDDEKPGPSSGVAIIPLVGDGIGAAVSYSGEL